LIFNHPPLLYCMKNKKEFFKFVLNLNLLVLALFISGCVSGIKVTEVKGIPGQGLDPLQITERVQESLSKVRSACVSVNRSSSGIIISPEGYVLTAGHVVAKYKDKKKPFVIVLEDGRVAEADFSGWDKANDMGMLKIRDESNSWPYAELADKVPPIASVCFLYAHTAGYRKSRPAQLRVGRIRTLVPNNGSPRFIFSDASVQPGDSGGGLFDIDGRLIGFCTTAGPIGVNRYTSIDSFHKGFEKLKKGEIWGDPEDAGLGTEPRKIDNPTKKLIVAEFQKRAKDKYRPVMDAVLAKAVKSGEKNVNLSFGQILKIIGMDAPMIMDGRKITYGIDAPELIKKLKKLPPESVLPLPVLVDKKCITFGIPVTGKHILVKHSEIKKYKKLKVMLKNKKIVPVTVSGIDNKWDLAIIEVGDDQGLTPVIWPQIIVNIKAGTGLMAPDIMGRMSWGVASDKRRPLKKAGRAGPMLNKSRVSGYRAPYPSMISHNLPLYAKHAGVPVYTLHGELVGVHMGRICRTLGLIVDIHDVRKSVTEMLKNKR
jgi:hypothetical protein